MKKLAFLCIILAFSTQVSAQLSEKQLIGSWGYTAVTDQGNLTGVLAFSKEKGILVGQGTDAYGNKSPLKNITLKKENVLYFEVTPEYEMYTVTITIDGDAFSGMAGPPSTKVEIYGEKVK